MRFFIDNTFASITLDAITLVASFEYTYQPRKVKCVVSVQGEWRHYI